MKIKLVLRRGQLILIPAPKWKCSAKIRYQKPAPDIIQASTPSVAGIGIGPYGPEGWAFG
jgi:hypothetical protein